MKITDKMRLDWLSCNYRRIDPWMSRCGFVHWVEPVGDRSWKSSIRAAIDAAIRAERREASK